MDAPTMSTSALIASHTGAHDLHALAAKFEAASRPQEATFSEALETRLQGSEQPRSAMEKATVEEQLNQQKDAIRQFEAMFAALLIKELRSSAKSLFEGDSTDSLGALFDQHMGQAMTEGGGLGLANQLNRYLEVQQQASLRNES